MATTTYNDADTTYNDADTQYGGVTTVVLLGVRMMMGVGLAWLLFTLIGI